MLPAGYIFMIGLSLVLLINYPGGKAQMQRIAAHAPAALSMGMIILAAGSMLGIFTGTGMLTSIAQDLVQVRLPRSCPACTSSWRLRPADGADAEHRCLLLRPAGDAGSSGEPWRGARQRSLRDDHRQHHRHLHQPVLARALACAWPAGLDLGRHIRYSLWWMWGFALFAVAWALGMF